MIELRFIIRREAIDKFNEAEDGSVEIGGADRDRTGDLYNAIVALSQLSYGPTRWDGGILRIRRILSMP